MQYEGSGDVFFTFYKGDTILDTMPTKDDTELTFERAECDKGASIVWNFKKWEPMITNLKESKTKCKLYFAQNVANDYFERLAEKDTATLAYDDTNDKNLRYIGKEVNNYIDIGDRYSGDVYRGYMYENNKNFYRKFSTLSSCSSDSVYHYNCEKIHSSGEPILWRIIGVMNDISVLYDNKLINLENLVKIIRAEDIGEWTWDSSRTGINSGYGINEWSQADIMTTLNYETYWSKTSGQCYDGSRDSQTSCDFINNGFSESAKEKLAKIRWNTGTFSSNNNAGWFPNAAYQAERSSNNGKGKCNDTYDCNDKVERTTTWDGYIGLMYPSDYGYAVGGDVRNSCLATSMHDWGYKRTDCRDNDWLYPGKSQWLITPIPYSIYAFYVFNLVSDGSIDHESAFNKRYVYPTAYLKSSIKIKESSASDYGSSGNPFVIES